MDLQKELEIAIKQAREAGSEILKIYTKDFVVEYKDDKSPLTEADKRANDVIVPVLKNSFPEYSILSEESKEDENRHSNSWCWIIDPLDGTKEFIKKNGEFTVNIALAKDHKVVLGVIYVPVTGELYYAAKGIGAYYEKDWKKEQIKVTDRVYELRLVGSRSHGSEELTEMIKKYGDRITDFKSAGSSLKGCMVAKGDADIYYRFGLTMEWDTAAMQCIVEEAGGIFKQMDGSEMLYNRKNSLNEKGFYVINRKENIFV